MLQLKVHVCKIKPSVRAIFTAGTHCRTKKQYKRYGGLLKSYTWYPLKVYVFVCVRVCESLLSFNPNIWLLSKSPIDRSTHLPSSFLSRYTSEVDNICICFLC